MSLVVVGGLECKVSSLEVSLCLGWRLVSGMLQNLLGALDNTVRLHGW